MSNNNITLDCRRLLGFNQLSTVSKTFETPTDQLEDLRGLANKIGDGERFISDIGRLSNKISGEVAVFRDKT